MKLLVIEDDPALAASLARSMRFEGYDLDVERSGSRAGAPHRGRGRLRRARRGASRDLGARAHPPPAAGGQPDADPDAHGTPDRGRPGRGAGRRCAGLRGQAVRRRGGARAAAGPPAPQQRRSRTTGSSALVWPTCAWTPAAWRPGAGDREVALTRTEWRAAGVPDEQSSPRPPTRAPPCGSRCGATTSIPGSTPSSRVHRLPAAQDRGGAASPGSSTRCGVRDTCSGNRGPGDPPGRAAAPATVERPDQAGRGLDRLGDHRPERRRRGGVRRDEPGPALSRSTTRCGRRPPPSRSPDRTHRHRTRGRTRGLTRGLTRGRSRGRRTCAR